MFTCRYQQLNMNGTDAPSRILDSTLATILTICVLFSVPLNSIAFIFFYQQKAKRKNGIFFNRLYMAVTLIDALICILQLPTIDSLYHGRESRRWTFNNTQFCKFWAATKETALALSISLVAVLSISRLCLLKYRSRQLKPSLAIWLPVGFLIVHATVIPVFYYTKYLNARPSESGNFMCYLCGYFEIKNETNYEYIEQHYLVTYMVVQSIRAALAGLPFFPIFISFCISLHLLRRSRNKVSAKSSVKRQDKASSTIILFTSMYVICNVPLTLYVFYLTSLVAGLVADATNDPLQQISLLEYEATFSGSYFERHYVWILGVNLSSVLNSTLNPIVYVWRMRNFRDFLFSFKDSKVNSNLSTPGPETCKAENAK